MSDLLFESDDRTPKRMRLGTRSCAECRRRHVRCIFPPGSSVCEGCALHLVSCISQEANRQKKIQPERHGESTLHQQLKELEDVVLRIRTSVDRDPNSSASVNARAKLTEILSSLEQTSPGTSSSVEDNRITNNINRPPPTFEDISISLSNADDLNNLEEAPIISLFHDALRIQSCERQRNEPTIDPSRNNRMQDMLQRLKNLIPQPANIRLLLAETEKYWSTWPPCYLGPNLSDRVRSGGDCPMALLTKAFTSLKPALMAKAVVFLALCIQQLPKVLQHQDLNMQSSTEVVKSYMKITTSLLSISADIGESIDDVECLMLQSKLYINCGMPRKVWLSTRYALNTAFLLGLHHLHQRNDQRKRQLFDQIWQVDRHMAITLGFPCSISNSHPALAQDPGVQGVQQLARQLCLIGGEIIERNQNYNSVDYSVTVKLQEELDRLRAIMPEDWWNPIPSPIQSVGEQYYQSSIKIQYFLLCKHVHLPYMLKSTTSKKFEHSREVVLETSRELIKTYQGLRNSAQAEFVMCEAMEFGAFCAAAVLIIDIFARRPQRSLGEELEDVRLVDGLVLTLRRFDSIMECSVASQAAQLLEFLSAVYRGSYNGPENFEAVIPYFGRVRINWRSVVGSRTESDDQFSATKNPSSKTVEFSTSTFGFPMPADPYLEAEIGLDWTTTMGTDDVYDWFQTFDLQRHFLLQ